MAETSDWKQKYRDSLREMEAEEKRWRQVEQALRRLVGRLCAAGMGVNPQLDDELIAVAAANRRNADAAALDKMAEALTMTVVAVDAVSPVPTITLAALPILAAPPARAEAACTAAGKVLQCLRSFGDEEQAVRELATRLSQARTDAQLGAVLDKIADLLHRHGESLARERVQAAAVYAEVARRLDEMSGYLTDTADSTRSHLADSAAVHDTVISHVQELKSQVGSATELAKLQTLATSRLAEVQRQVAEFRAREQARLSDQVERTESMRARIATLERETHDLHSRLDREKHGARLDPLTRVANRKSFDERLAHELAHAAPAGVPTCMLVWDLDNFKSINDSYGHRAGDRVLQSVATCLMSGIRPEDFVARIGGEEFVVLLTGVPFERALAIAEELRARVGAMRFHFRGTPVRVTVSCGLTEVRGGDAGDAAFERADGALYTAKSGGKNMCVTA